MNKSTLLLLTAYVAPTHKIIVFTKDGHFDGHDRKRIQV